MEKKRKVYQMSVDENDPESGVFNISLVSEPAVGEKWIALSEDKKPVMLAATGDKQELLGLVLVPNKYIPRIDETTGEEYDIVFPEETIAKSAELFMSRQYNNSTSIEHDDRLKGNSVIESWIVENPEMDKTAIYKMNAPKGSWAIKMKVNDKELWDAYVKTGTLQGFSLEGLYSHKLVELSKEDGDQEKVELIKKLLSDITESI
jgi:hypothetical protein